MADDYPVTLESIVGLTLAIEVLQEVLFANRIVSPELLAKKYDEVAQQYFAAGRPEVVSTLEVLIARLRDVDRSSERALLQTAPKGSA